MFIFITFINISNPSKKIYFNKGISALLSDPSISV